MRRENQDPSRIIDRARAYVLDNLWHGQIDAQLTETDALLEQGVIDSMGLVDLISFIQEEFGIDVSGDEITPENFGTLSRIATYVLTKGAAKARS